MDQVGWYVGGFYAYAGLAIGAALFVGLGVAVIRGQRRMRSLEERLARAERAGEERREREIVRREPARGLDDEDGEDEEGGDALIPTPLGPDEEPQRVDREMFWDLLLRESVVRAAAVAHGVRSVLDPPTRNRIRFEVRQEIKRARKQRKAEERAAVRQLRQDRLEDAS